MEKNVFFNSFNAKSVLSCVALATSMMFASCQKESFSVGNVPTPETPIVNNAIVYLTTSTYDLIGNQSIEGLTYSWTGSEGTADGNSYSVKTNADKSISAGQVTVVSSGSEYFLEGKTEFKFPALAAGQVVFIDKPIYTLPIGAVIDEIPVISYDNEIERTEFSTQLAGENDSDMAKDMDITFTVEAGAQILNLAKIEAEINAGTNGLPATTRAVSDNDVKKILITVLRALNDTYEAKTYQLKSLTVPAKSSVKVNIVQKGILSLNTTMLISISNVVYQIEGLTYQESTENTVKVIATTENGHEHILHGSSINAGGGIGGK